MRKHLVFLCISILLLVLSVGAVAEQPQAPPATVTDLLDTAVPKRTAGYATGFSTYSVGGLTVITVDQPWQGATEEDRLVYVLYPRGSEAPEITGADAVIPVPVERIVTMSTTFLPHLEVLGALDTLVGVDSLAWVFSREVRAMGAEGRVAEIGSGPSVDIEIALALSPDVIMVNSYGGEWDAQPVLEAAGLPVVVLGDWVETDPIGRAEWLVFTALLTGHFEEAVDYVEARAQAYELVRGLAASAPDRPTVLVNAPYQGTWAVSGGASYAARLIEDAGGDYVWADDDSTGSLFMDIESVFAEAGDADIWINPGTWTSLADGRAEDARFTAFAAFASGEVYNNNRRVTPAGGNDYHESGAIHPDDVLADLVNIFHPGTLESLPFLYYQKLQ